MTTAGAASCQSANHPVFAVQPSLGGRRKGSVGYRPICGHLPLAPAALGREAALMIDQQKREVAAKLIRQFRDGEITSDDLESDWPSRSEDKALGAIESRVWAFYDDHRPRRMVGREAASAEERELLTRYAAFLISPLPYEWSKSNFYGLGGCGIMVILSLGLLWPVDWWIKRRNAREELQLRREGDLDVWPFIRRSERDRYVR